jgi:hypothetical protein
MIVLFSHAARLGNASVFLPRRPEDRPQARIISRMDQFSIQRVPRARVERIAMRAGNCRRRRNSSYEFGLGFTSFRSTEICDDDSLEKPP